MSRPADPSRSTAVGVAIVAAVVVTLVVVLLFLAAASPAEIPDDALQLSASGRR